MRRALNLSKEMLDALVDNSMPRQANYRIGCMRPAASPYGQFMKRRQVRV
jgi:hypothetical protein